MSGRLTAGNFCPIVSFMGHDILTSVEPNSMLLTALDEDAREELLGRGRKKSYRKGEMIFARGDEGDSLIVVLSGRVEVSVTAMNGRKSVLDHMGAGAVLGEVAMMDNGTRSADVIAGSKVDALILGRADIKQFLVEHPEAMVAMIAELCAKVRNASDMFENQAQVVANNRLARCLLRFGEKWGKEEADGSVRIEQPFSQADIGEFSGLARENVNRHLKAWEADGIIKIDGRMLVLLDTYALEDIAEL